MNMRTGKREQTISDCSFPVPQSGTGFTAGSTPANQALRERGATPEEIEGTGKIGQWLTNYEKPGTLFVTGFSVKRRPDGWTLCVRAWLQGENVVAFGHLWRLSELGQVFRDRVEGDEWKPDRFAKQPPG